MQSYHSFVSKKWGQNRVNFLEGLIFYVFSYKKWTLVYVSNTDPELSVHIQSLLTRLTLIRSIMGIGIAELSLLEKKHAIN